LKSDGKGRKFPTFFPTFFVLFISLFLPSGWRVVSGAFSSAALHLGIFEENFLFNQLSIL